MSSVFKKINHQVFVLFFFFSFQTLKSAAYSIRTVHLNSISRHTWLMVTLVDHAGLENEETT